MGRRKKGRDVHGWLILDKPLNVGSTEVVSKARWALQAKKAGHAGTLDPLATGVLAVAFGEATKTVPFVTDGLKGYRFTVPWASAPPPTTARGRWWNAPTSALTTRRSARPSTPSAATSSRFPRSSRR